MSGRMGLALKTIRENLLLSALLLIIMVVPLVAFLVYQYSNSQVLLPLSSKEMDEVSGILTNEEIPFDISGEGLLVTENDLLNVQALLSGKNVGAKERVGYEIFQGNDIGLSDISRRVGYTRALQGELEQTILMMPGVDEVRVHVNLPEKTRVGKVKQPGSAAVYLKLESEGYLSHLEYVLSDLMHASLPGIESKDIKIISEYGEAQNRELLSLPMSLRIRSFLEQSYREKSISLLSRMFKQESFAVELTVKINTSKTTTKKSVPLSGERAKDAVLLNSKNRTVKSSKDKDSESTSVVERNYQVGMVNETTQGQEYSLESVSVGVLLPSDLSDSEVAVIKNMLMSALSLDESRGDTIVVANLLNVGGKLPSVIAEHVD